MVSLTCYTLTIGWIGSPCVQKSIAFFSASLGDKISWPLDLCNPLHPGTFISKFMNQTRKLEQDILLRTKVHLYAAGQLKVKLRWWVKPEEPQQVRSQHTWYFLLFLHIRNLTAHAEKFQIPPHLSCV